MMNIGEKSLQKEKRFIMDDYIPIEPKYPAMLIKLKYEKGADTAIAQIHRQKYPDRLELYKGKLILVGLITIEPYRMTTWSSSITAVI